MPSQGWTPWVQPADLVLTSDTAIGLWGYHFSEGSGAWTGNTVFPPDFSGEDFDAAAAAVASGNVQGYAAVGSAHYTDYADQGPAWLQIPNLPKYGVGFRGAGSAPSGLILAASWNFQGESSLSGHSTTGLWTYAATVAADDPTLIWNLDPEDYPPYLLSVDDMEWEHPLYPWEDAVDYVGGPQFVWDTASCQFVSGSIVAHVDGSDSDATNRPWTLNIGVYSPDDYSDVAFMHTHGTTASKSMYEGVPAEDINISLGSEHFPTGYPTLPPLLDVDPGFYDDPSTPTERMQTLAGYGFPNIAASFTHAGMAGGSWDWDVGDGSTDVYNTQRAAVDTVLTVVLRPSRVRFLITYAEEPNLAGGLAEDRRRFEVPGGVV